MRIISIRHLDSWTVAGRKFIILESIQIHIMDLSWLYDIPAFIFFLLVILFFAGFSVSGYMLVRKRVERWLGEPPAQNEVISIISQPPGSVWNYAWADCRGSLGEPYSRKY
jgi:hypothetical protein